MAEIYESEDIAAFIDPNYCDQQTNAKSVVGHTSTTHLGSSEKSEKKSSIMSLFIKRDSS